MLTIPTEGEQDSEGHSREEVESKINSNSNVLVVRQTIPRHILKHLAWIKEKRERDSVMSLQTGGSLSGGQMSTFPNRKT